MATDINIYNSLEAKGMLRNVGDQKSNNFVVKKTVKKKLTNIVQIVNALESCGNSSKYTVFPHDGYGYAMAKPIDFCFLGKNFELPEHFSLDEGNDVIFDPETWIMIYGPGYRDNMWPYSSR